MDPLRVLSYNVRVDTEEDGDDAWPHRRDEVAATLRYHAPDVLGLQEPLAHQFDYLRERLDGAVVGDANLEPAAAVAEHTHGPATTRTDFHGLVPDEKIDHVFVGDDARVDQHAILTDRTEQRYPSDHLPVVADLVR